MKTYTCFLPSGETVKFRDILWSEWKQMYENPSIIENCITEGQLETPEDLEAYTVCILDTLGIKKPNKKQEEDEYAPEYHLTEGIMMHFYHQPDTVIQSMEVRRVLLLVKDIPIISGQEKLDPMRHSEKPDKKGLRSLKGHGGVGKA